MGPLRAAEALIQMRRKTVQLLRGRPHAKSFSTVYWEHWTVAGLAGEARMQVRLCIEIYKEAVASQRTF